MSESYGDAREKIGKLSERKEILEDLLRYIDLCRSARDRQAKGSVERELYSRVIDSLIFVAQGIQGRSS